MTTETYVLKGSKYVIKKDPDAVLDYTLSFADWLTEIADTIQLAEAPVASGVAVDAIVNTDTTVTIWVSGGTLWAIGQPYASVTVRITTVAGRIDERTVYFKVVQR